MKRLLMSFFAGLMLLNMHNVYAASAEAQAVAEVVSALNISHSSDLNFGSGVQGAVAKTVQAGTSENSENASFDVFGESNATYSITLPSSIDMTKDDGAKAEDTIKVESFSSFPSSTGQLNSSGDQELFVGATRAALKSNQEVGSYIGVFTVEVAYN